MAKYMFFSLVLMFSVTALFGQQTQSNAATRAARIDQPGQLGDSVYQLLAPYQIIMVGEMHGTNEPAQFVSNLAYLLAHHGDSVLLGLEIPADKMAVYFANRTEESIYASDFFAHPSFESGRESHAWATVIARFLSHAQVKVFFFDVGAGEQHDRDSMMYLNLKLQLVQHPHWKMLTLSGNIHNMTSPMVRLGRHTMASLLVQDEALQLSDKICSLNNYYWKGKCRANFGKGLEERILERPENQFDRMFDADHYLYLMPSDVGYPYTGMYYSRFVTASTMVREQ